MEPTKTCTSCGAEVLAAADVCRHCRHRFDPGSDASEGASQPGTLTAPGRRQRRRVPPIVWIAAAVAAIAVVVVIAVGSGSSSSSTNGSTSSSAGGPVITGAKVESQLSSQLQSKSGDPVSSVSCPNQNLYGGDKLDCNVAFQSGRTQAVIVTVTGTSANPHIAISLG